MNTELTQQTAPEKKNFDFVDTIRCISMMGIVWEHSRIYLAPKYHSMGAILVEASTIAFFKFSTIAFFLIGGFLINHKFQEYSANQYLKNRFKNTIKPWLFWMFIFIALSVLDRYVAYFKGSDVGLMSSNFLLYITRYIVWVLFFSPYWFILNFLICITILLIFKKHLYNYRLGIMLGLVSLLYSVNLYFRWFETSHTSALFGFVFYLWVGVYLNKHYSLILSFLKKTPWIFWVMLVALSFVLSISESLYLTKLGSTDAYNTLRISNILYSFIVFGALLKLGSIKVLNYLKPRETTFGIYLVHIIIIERFLPLIFQPLKLDIAHYTVWQNTGLLLIRFLIAYVMSYFLTKLIVKTKMKWSMGR